MKVLRKAIGCLVGLLLAEVLVLVGLGAAFAIGGLVQRAIH